MSVKHKNPASVGSEPTQLELPANEASPESLVGRVIADRYEIEALLGVGGMGAVYRARHVHIRKQVALKTLHPSMLRSPEAVARFEREAIAAARINHPNVVVSTDYGQLPDGRYYLVLEYIDGRDLRHFIASRGPLDLPLTLQIARQITAALTAAHGHDIVHRDLKPENIMLVERPLEPVRVKVLDFGIAKISLEDKSQPLTQMGAVFGTPQYMSPEQAKGLEVDARSDLYSLGIILFEMLTGALPFDADDALGYLMQHLGTAPKPLPKEVPESLRTLVAKLLEKSPEDRLPSAAAVHHELERIESARVMQAASQAISQPTGGAAAKLLGHALQQGRALGQFLLRPQRFKGLSLPLGVWLLLPTALGLTLVVHFTGQSSSSAADASLASPTASAAAPGSNLPTLQRDEFRAQIERISQLKSYQRTELDWMILARGSSEMRDFETSVSAYQALLSLRKDLRKDPQLLADILQAAQDPKAFRMALNLSETVLGRQGVDLIWLLWDDFRLVPDRQEQADKLAKKLRILSHRASPALKVAIELTFASSCDKVLAQLGRAATEADQRSLARLTELSRKEGCGPTKQEDCFACLRESPLLEEALKRARITPMNALGQSPDDGT